MEIPVTEQVIQAASSLLLGAAAGFLYDFFRVVRRRAPSGTVTMIADFLFWLVCGAGLFLLGLSLGGGRQRIFMSVVAVTGATLYFITLSRISLAICNKLADIIIFILFCLSRPVVWLYLAMKKICLFIKNIFHYLQKWYKLEIDNVFRPSHQIRLQKARSKGVQHEAEKGRYHYENYHLRNDRLRIGSSYQSQNADRRRPYGAGGAPPAGDGKRNVKRRASVSNRSQQR
ncbi:spore cortex biosynthesis protein YabQ [Oscillospiraceae bacterium CM]|nr:spore cortex biosynthesis protein YabQ [Oscillospiraceae bacterium CM]